MVSMYHGVSTGINALTYYRKNMEIAGINTSKANTTGYSRQAVNSQASAAFSTSACYSQLGTGVSITSVERIRDNFLDAQLRRTSMSQYYWNVIDTGLTRVSTMLVNTNETGLNNLLDSFWSSLQTVNTNSSDQAVRSVCIDEAENLVNFSSSLAQGYVDYRNELNDNVREIVEDTNLLIDQIAVLNGAIATARNAGAEPNELLDKRDLLVDELCWLIGVSAGSCTSEGDGDYKLSLGGVLLVQGTNTRHLVLVENEANKGYYDVQIEYNQYDISSNPEVAQVIAECAATNGTYSLEVLRTADETYWTVGCATSQSAGGSRMDGIGSATTSLGIEGSFALQVGSTGVRAYSNAFTSAPPGVGVMLGSLQPGETGKYSFRIAAGEVESTITAEWDSASSQWVVTDGLTGNTMTTTSGELTVSGLANFINGNLSSSGVEARAEGNALLLESANLQMLSITDVNGNLMQSCGLANKNPIVLIEVSSEDSLQTIANKINNAYNFTNSTVIEYDEEGNEVSSSNNLSYTTSPTGAAPSSAEQWLHATVEPDGEGGYFLCLTSNVAGETSRINVMSGSVCGEDVYDMTVARLLGLVGDTSDGQADVTSYIQIESNGTIVTRDTEGGDVFVDDACIRWDGVAYLSSSNTFAKARGIALRGEASANTLSEVMNGIRISIQETGTTTINVRHPITSGALYATLELRDDIILSQMDTFDDLMYKLATEFNAAHYAGYGTGDYAETTGMAFFQQIASKYGAFSQLALDKEMDYDTTRLATASGDGSGKSLGTGDGTNALSMAQLKQAKLFMSGTASFDDLYRTFVAEYGARGEHAKTMLEGTNYVVEQIEKQRDSIMGVNADEEMLKLVEMNQGFNYTSQYLTALLDVINQIITGVGRVGI